MLDLLEDAYLEKNSQLIDINNVLNVKILDIKRESPNLENQYISFEGSDGKQLISSIFSSFNISVELLMQTSNIQDYELKLNQLLSLMYVKDPYYFVREREPGKRYKVRPLPFSENRINKSAGTVSIEFEVFEGHAESLFTTLSSEGFNDTIFQFGQGLPTEDYQYQHNKNNFIIYNAGDFTVDPREHELIIAIKGVSEGAVNVFNKTTGERFIYNGSLYSTKGEVLTVDGVYPKKNGVNCGIETNGGLITLVPGENEIQISNLSRTEVSFDFRFLYK